MFFVFLIFRTFFVKNQLLTELFQAYFKARANKEKAYSVAKFGEKLEENIFDIYDEIVSRKYKPKPSICFGVQKPVSREIFAADFSDRIVHHLLYGYLYPIFEKKLINDCYSCREGRGVHFGISRAEKFIRSCSQNYNVDCFVLKLDIKSYFMSMRKDILFEMVKETLLEEESLDFDLDLVLFLLEKTIFERPETNCIFKGVVDVPFGKSLFDTPVNCGLPIGNLTSQLFGNVYLNDFDHFVKRDLGIKYYGRYVDDFLIVHNDIKYLREVLFRVKEYLEKEVKLVLHPDKIYLQHYSKGFKFLGAYIKPYRRYIVNRTKFNFKESLRNPSLNYTCSINSYLGLMSHCNSHSLRKSSLSSVLPNSRYGVNGDFSAIYAFKKS